MQNRENTTSTRTVTAPTGARRPILTLLLPALACLAGVEAVAQGIVNPRILGKSRNEYAAWCTGITFTVTMTMPGIAPPPAPTFTIDLYDEDDLTADDGRDVDLTEKSATVKVTRWKMRGTMGQNSFWDCFVSTGMIMENDITDPAPGDWPDPRVEIKVTVGGNTVTVDLCAPGLPSVGDADFGTAGPLRLGNVPALAGEPIAAFSRGHDDIAKLPTLLHPTRGKAALYFAMDSAYPIPGSDKVLRPGRVLVIDGNKDIWPEDLYAANPANPGGVVPRPAFLNLNTAPVGGNTATPEIYFVRQGTSKILYSATGDPARASLFLDLATTPGVSALALEDVAPRGTWSRGDRVLYAVERSSAIHTWGYGESRGYYGIPQETFFNGRPVLFHMLHFDKSSNSSPNYWVGNIRALSVSLPGRAIPVPAGRTSPHVVDHNGLFTYGPATHGKLRLMGNPVLGSFGFGVTLEGAAAGTWAMLLMGTPRALPGLTLPPAFALSPLLLDPLTLLPASPVVMTLKGTAGNTLPIPAQPALAGGLVGFQWVVYQPRTLPLALSDAGVAYLRRR